MKNIRFGAALLLLAMLASCGGTNTPAVSDTTASGEDTDAQTTEDTLKPDLPDKTYGSEVITIFQRAETKYQKDFYVEEATGDILDDAIFARNSAVSEQFGVEFELVLSANDYGNDAVNTILAGDDAYDLVVPHARSAFKYTGQGLALDWNDDLPYVDLDKPWWSDDARAAFSFCGKLFTMVGDISYMNLAATNAMLFNKAIFDEYKLEYPYKTVLDGKWTFDAFAALSRQAAKDLNGDTKFDVENDQMGYVTGHWIGPIQVLYTADQRICRKNEKDEMYMTLNTEKTVEVFEDYFALLKEPGMYCHIENGYDPLNKVFTDGRAMFIDMNIGDTMNLRDMKDDFGIIPWPKFDETVDKYYTNVDAGCNLVVVPVTVKNPECVSVVLEALAYHGYKTVLPTYYEVVLQTKYTRDEESSAMLDLIREGRVYDIGYFFDNSSFVYEINSIGRFLAHEAEPNFTTFYAKHEANAIAKLEEINQVYREME